MSLDLCNLSQVYELLGSGNEEHEEVISQLISGVSAQVETFMDRIVLSGTYTETHDVKKGQSKYNVDAYPITSVTTIHNDWDRTFGSSTLIDATDYYVDANQGSITIDKIRLQLGPGTLKIVYVGGMAATTDAFITAFPDINAAVVSEVAYRFKRRDEEAIIAMAAGGSSITHIAKKLFLPVLEETLYYHTKTL